MDFIKKILSTMTLRKKIYQTVIQRSERYIYDDTSAVNIGLTEYCKSFLLGR